MPHRPRITIIRKTFPSKDGESVESAAEYIGAKLSELGVGRKYAGKTELLSEETISLFKEHAPEGAPLKVRVSRFFGDVSVSLSMKGEEFDPVSFAEEPGDEPDELTSENALRSLLIRSHGENYQYRCLGGVNHARILTGQNKEKSRNYTLIALLLGVLFGLFVKFVLPASAADVICNYVMTPIRTMFMNALNIIIAPVVFFSIVTCFSQFGSFKDFGKLGVKVLGMYLFTTLIAVLLGIGMFMLFRPGTFGFAASLGQTAAVSPELSGGEPAGLLETIMGIVPSNFVAPFLEANTLQIIFLAVLCGVAVGLIGQYSKLLKDLFEALNSLFLTITTIIAKVIPVAVFASLTIMVVSFDARSFLSVGAGVGVELLTILIMTSTYGLLVSLLAGLNPVTFYKKAREGMLTSFTLCSTKADSV